MEIEFLTHSKDETIRLGEYVSKLLKVGDIILLTGDLGAGKTTFTQGVANGLGIVEKVISPTFNILKCYFNKKLNLYHIDAYRLENNKSDIGLEEFIEGDGVCLIEWPNYIDYLIPNDYIEISIKYLGDNNRSFIFKTDSNKYISYIEEIKKYA